MIQKRIEKGRSLSFSSNQKALPIIGLATRSLTILTFTFASFSTGHFENQFGMLVRARPIDGEYSALRSVPPIDTVEVYELKPMSDGGFETVPVQTQPGPSLPSTDDPAVSQQITTQTGAQTTTQNTAQTGTQSGTGTDPSAPYTTPATQTTTGQTTSTSAPTQSSTIGDTPQTAGHSDVGVDPCQPSQGSGRTSTSTGANGGPLSTGGIDYDYLQGTTGSAGGVGSGNCGQTQTSTASTTGGLGDYINGGLGGGLGGGYGGGLGTGMVNPYITLGLFAYDLVVGSQPKVLANTNKGVSVLPIATNEWAKMTGWTGPHTKTYQILYKSMGGKMTAVTFIFQVNYYANGNLGNKGKYLANVMVIPKKVDVSWGYSFDANFAAGDTINMGTVDSPIPGVHFQIQYRAHTILKRVQGITSFFVRGNGQLVKVE